ncbi:MAG TPA: DedA family protein [Opitutus sp.]|nr:DedA family protein [Opitutus sp.]
MSDWIKSIIEQFSYPGIVFLLFLENVFPPIPSELIIPLAGFVSTQGQISLAGVIVAGTAGSVAGAIVLYGVGRRLGAERLRRWCDKHGRWVGLTRKDLERSDRWFRRHGAKTVLLGRVVPGVRSLISIPAGVAGMDMRVFLLYTTLGSAAWTAALALAGRMLGRNYERVEQVIGPVSTTVVVLIILTWVIRALRTATTADRHD